MRIVPDSATLREYNKCHEPKGPGGGRFCSTDYLQGEVARAKKHGVSMKIDPKSDIRDSGYYPDKRRIVVGLDAQRGWSARRSAVLSTARHELGHVTDATYGREGKPAQRLILGQPVQPEYAEEFGAWKAALRDSGGRVSMGEIKQSLKNYLYDDVLVSNAAADRVRIPKGPSDDQYELYTAAVGAEIDKVLDSHVTLLRRYARTVRRRP